MKKQCAVFIGVLAFYIGSFVLILGSPQSVEAAATFCRPAGGRVTSSFGPRVINRVTDYHFGTDFAGADKGPVYAVADGYVASDWSKDRMHALTIKHTSKINNLNVWTRYLHMDRIQVSYGSTVRAGQLIGYKSSVGAAGPHLHFELIMSASSRLDYTKYKKVDPTRQNTGWVDPIRWIDTGTSETCSRLQRPQPQVPTPTKTLTPVPTVTYTPSPTPSPTPFVPVVVTACSNTASISRLATSYTGYGWHAQSQPYNPSYPPHCPPAYWTRPGNPQLDSIRWSFAPTVSGRYKVQIYIPSLNVSPSNNTRHATYSVLHADGTSVVYIDQQVNIGKTLEFGPYRFVKGTTYNVTLTDFTGEADHAELAIAADTIVWTLVP